VTWRPVAAVPKRVAVLEQVVRRLLDELEVLSRGRIERRDAVLADDERETNDR
jgi:hypothetical protein